MEEIVAALNAYINRMIAGEIPQTSIPVRMVGLNDVLINDKLSGKHFESGNLFALTDTGAIVCVQDHALEKINQLFFVTDPELDKAINEYNQMVAKMGLGKY